MIGSGGPPQRHHRPRKDGTVNRTESTSPSAVNGCKRARHLKVAGLFAGIGGIELGLHRAGHETLLLCENDPSARAVLATRFGDIEKQPEDIRDLRSLPRETELIAAGFPCQDLSQAGMTRGIHGERSGLIGEVFRLLRRRRVPLLLIENVPFMLQLSKGKALEVIVGTLERFGYKWAYRIVDTRAFGLPQRRERVFMVAALDEDPRKIVFADDAGEPTAPTSVDGLARGFYWTEGTRGLGWAVDAVPTLKGGSTIGIPSPPAIVMPDGEIICPEIRDAERLQGFETDWTKPAEGKGKRSYRWKLVGNAVTVDVAHWIGDRLSSPGTYDPHNDTELSEGQPWPRAAWNVGKGRFRSHVSAWPVRRKRQHLHTFLKYPGEPLSLKATAGFFSRASASRVLRFPDGFLDTVEAHLDRMRELVSA